MTQIDFQAPAELYLGSDWHAAAAQGPKAFRTAAQAIRFALEEAAPVSLRGASLNMGGQRHSNDAMIWAYRSPDYPLQRKKPHQPSPVRQRAMSAKEPT